MRGWKWWRDSVGEEQDGMKQIRVRMTAYYLATIILMFTFFIIIIWNIDGVCHG